jgi:hypothetical protein
MIVQIKEVEVYVFGTTIFLQAAEYSFTSVAMSAEFKNYLRFFLGPYNNFLKLALIREVDPMHKLNLVS